MALVCDKSDDVMMHEEGEEETAPPASEPNEDLEDGEIEDDGDDELVEETKAPVIAAKAPSPKNGGGGGEHIKVDDKKEKERADKKARHEKKHLTEAEKSVMRLHKIERLEREKREKFRREQALHSIEPEEDFATALEKAIAKVLKKDKNPSEEEKEEDNKRSNRKRKKRDKHRKNAKKSKQLESPKSGDEIDENEMLNVRGGSPELMMMKERTPQSPKSEEQTEESDSSSERSRSSDGRRRKHKRGYDKGGRDRKYRDRSRERDKRNKVNLKRNTGICLYYLQGMCDNDNCPYSHESIQPMKLELCKFYLLECCAKGDKCLYMHSDFPCKYYHTGIPCPYGDKCKFAHGGPLSDNLKQILFKHIETAPKEILGNFPRLSRENASVMIIQAQKNLENKYGPLKKDGAGGAKDDTSSNSSAGNKNDIPSLLDINIGNPGDCEGDSSGKGDSSMPTPKKENKRSRPSRWQDPDPIVKTLQEKQLQLGFNIKSGGFKDQDMRITSNGDVDMRTLNMQPSVHPTNIVNPNILAQKPPPILAAASNLIQPNMLLPNLLAQTSPNLLPSLLQQSNQLPLQNVINSAVSLINSTLLAQQQQQQQQQNVPQLTTTTTTTQSASDTSTVDIEKYKMEARLTSTVGLAGDTSNDNKDVDIRQEILAHQLQQQPVQPEDKLIMDVTATQQQQNDNSDEDEQENKLQIVVDEEEVKSDIPSTLPKTQRDLYKRIQAQQRDNVLADQSLDDEPQDEPNIDWYSDDEDDNKLTIKDDDEDTAGTLKAPQPILPAEINEPSPIKPIDEVVEKLGDLSKIDISAEVTKLLSTIQQSSSVSEKRDPRLSGDKAASKDPRTQQRLNSSEEQHHSQQHRSSIYEPSNIGDVDLRAVDSDMRAFNVGRPDVDLRQIGLSFKGMENYTPASEIDASINSHKPMVWIVYIVDIPKPDYTGLKLSAMEAQSTGDPRLRKLFGLNSDDKDSPASPKESPKASVPRVDPRRKKMEEQQAQQTDASAMTYNQQLTMLQSSPFYQNLTSNQKLMLNQELASRNDQSGQSDPIIAAMLQNLGLLPPSAQNVGGQSQAMNILANVNNLAFPPPQNLPMGGQGLLGPAPPGLGGPGDFPMNFDPRNGGPGLLGNGPPPFGNFPPPDANFAPGGGGAPGGNFNDEFYPEPNQFNQGGGGNNNQRGDNRGFRDRPRRGRNNNRNNNNNNRNFFRRHNNNRNRNSPG